jgi:hypothetical protein
MKMKLWNLACVALCAFVLLSVVGCGAQTTKQSKSGETYYTKYNFHYTTEKGKAWGSVANLTKPPAHKILPYGSPVKIEPWKRGFNLIAPKSGKTINVVSKKKYLEGKSLSEYLDLILSTAPVSYTDLSEIDQKGISEGRPYNGMSKKGVMIALGYPCPNKTASPKADTWYYWENRFDNYPVNFKNDLVVSSGYKPVKKKL